MLVRGQQAGVGHDGGIYQMIRVAMNGLVGEWIGGAGLGYSWRTSARAFLLFACFHLVHSCSCQLVQNENRVPFCRAILA